MVGIYNIIFPVAQYSICLTVGPCALCASWTSKESVNYFPSTFWSRIFNSTLYSQPIAYGGVFYAVRPTAACDLSVIMHNKYSEKVIIKSWRQKAMIRYPATGLRFGTYSVVLAFRSAWVCFLRWNAAIFELCELSMTM